MQFKVSILAGKEKHELNKIKSEYEGSKAEELATLITKEAWSPFQFQNPHPDDPAYKHRSTVSFCAANVFAVDVDDGLPIDEAHKKLVDLGLACIIGTSKNHQKEKNGITCDRYRIVFFLSETIYLAPQVKQLFFKVDEMGFGIDAACKDAARFYYPCREIYAILDGAPLQVPEYIKENTVNTIISKGGNITPNEGNNLTKLPLSKKSMSVIKNGVEKGNRNNALRDILHDAIQQQWSESELLEFLRTEGAAHDWLYDSVAVGKINERYKNFTPTHPPRVPSTTNKPQIIPLNQVKSLLLSWLEKNDVAVSYNRTMYIYGAPALVEDVVRKVVIELAGLNLAVNERLLEYTLLEWVEEKRHDHLEAVRAEVNGFNEELGDAACRKFLTVLKGDANNLDIVVFKHMIWQIKRKLNGHATKYEMMFVLTGGQGAGKSHILRHYFFKPLGDLAYSSAGFEALSDQREGRLFSDHYAIMFDEMSGAQKADMERVKQIITSGIIKQRRMGTTSHDSIPMNATFFGTANAPLETLIRDNTGMRRFWELVVDEADITRQRWARLDTINLIDMWRSVDETSDKSPIEPFLFEIQKTQEKLRDRSVYEFLLEQNVIEPTTNLDEYTSATALTNAVNVVMGSQWSSKALSKEWARFKLPIKRTSFGTHYGVRIIDADVLHALRTKYAMKLGGKDKEGYSF